MIGFPGEDIQIKDGEVIIFNKENKEGMILDEPYLPDDVKTYGMSSDKVKLGENEFFVLGDNRNSSKDSRSFGPVNRSYLIGKVLFRGFPFDRIQIFEAPKYSF